MRWTRRPIAILFATFFAAHALWNLIPSLVTFALLALVTVMAVLLSIRRESLFIAVLGLPWWVRDAGTALDRREPPDSALRLSAALQRRPGAGRLHEAMAGADGLTLVLTTIYQWGWVIKFLTASSVSLAMGVFLLFPIAAFAGLLLAGRGRTAGDSDPAGGNFERTAVISAAMPLLFAFYLAAVPAYACPSYAAVRLPVSR